MLPTQRQKHQYLQARNGYNRTSIAFHWITVVAMLSLFFTHEAPDDSVGQVFHISGGAILGVFLLWRVMRRSMRGFADKPKQAVGYNRAASIVQWGFLISIVLVVISGYLIPWTLGHALVIYNFSIPSPFTELPLVHGWVDSVHNFSGHLILPLLLVHVLGVLKHAIIDRDDVPARMFKSVKRGR